MEPQRAYLHILPERYKELVDSPEEEIPALAEEFFICEPEMEAEYLPICELLENFLQFSQQSLQSFAACALFTTLADLHALNVLEEQNNLKQLALRELLQFTYEIPNFSISCLNYGQAVKCAEFIDEFYIQPACFYRYLFAPQPIMQIKCEATRELTVIESRQELGAEPPQTPLVTEKAKSIKSRPPSKMQLKAAHDLEIEPDAAFKCTILPLECGELYVEGQPPSKEEEEKEELKQEIIKIVEEAKDQAVSEEEEIDVDKMAKALSLAATEELEKVREKIMHELESGKKGKK